MMIPVVPAPSGKLSKSGSSVREPTRLPGCGAARPGAAGGGRGRGRPPPGARRREARTSLALASKRESVVFASSPSNKNSTLKRKPAIIGLQALCCFFSNRHIMKLYPAIIFARSHHFRKLSPHEVHPHSSAIVFQSNQRRDESPQSFLSARPSPSCRCRRRAPFPALRAARRATSCGRRAQAKQSCKIDALYKICTGTCVYMIPYIACKHRHFHVAQHAHNWAYSRRAP